VNYPHILTLSIQAAKGSPVGRLIKYAKAQRHAGSEIETHHFDDR
jgi:hypothetical protein